MFPKISLILPTYNVGKYIARALDSCINQTFKDIEIIVVDDNGVDNSIEIARKYASIDSRIKIIHNDTNLQLLQSRIVGAKNAKADFIMFLDPDDELDISACEVIYRSISSDIDIIYYGLKEIVGELNINYLSFEEAKKVTLNEFMSIYQKRWSMCIKAIRKDFFNDSIKILEGVRCNMAEDALLSFVLFANFNRDRYINLLSDNLYYYYRHGDSITSYSNDDLLMDIKFGYLKVFKIIKLLNSRNCIDKIVTNYFMHGLKDNYYHLFYNYYKSCKRKKVINFFNYLKYRYLYKIHLLFYRRYYKNI